MKSAVVLASALSLCACANLPHREAAAQPKATASYASARSFAAPMSAWPTDTWWKSYGDQQLDALVAEAFAGSPNLAIADARLRRARSFVDTARSQNRPQVSATIAPSEQKQSYNYLSPPSFTPRGWQDYGRATLDLNWELDFWGKNRARIAAATSDVEAAQADAAQARLALSAAIASAYAELAYEYAALDTASAASDLRRKTVELFRDRHEHGLEIVGSVRQSESRYASAVAEVLAVEEQIALVRNQLAALLGAGPDRGLAIERPTLDLGRTFSLPANLAADLLGRRPDLQAARLRASSAAQRVKQAEAAFYPNVNLTALVGLQSLGLDMLTKDGSSIGSAGPAISLPIFTGGRLRAQLRGADAEYAEAVATYDATVTQALHEVADAATSQKALAAQVERIDEAVEAARDAWQAQQSRYAGGLSNYLDVLSAEDYLLSNLRVQTELNARSLILDVALQRALGGGYTNAT